MIFVPGWCSNLTHWDAQARYFGRHHRVLRIDRRGMGHSTTTGAASQHAEQHAKDFARIARRERIRNAIVVAHAGGGPAALVFAKRNPALVRALVLVDTNINERVDLRKTRDPRAQAFLGMLARMEGRNGRREFRQMYSGYFSDHAERKMARRAIDEAMAVPMEIATAELRSLTMNSAGVARSLSQPILWLTVRGADEDRLGSIFQNVQFGQAVGSGHFPHLEVPDQVNAMISTFVSQQ